MRKRYHKSRQHEPGRDLGGSASAAICLNRIDPLALPRIDAAIMDRPPTAKEVQLALNWLEAGYLDDSMLDWPAHRLVRTGMERWARRWLGETPMLSELRLFYSVEGSMEGADECWDFGIDIEPTQVRLLAPVFQSIEDKAPGLFETAIYTLENVVDLVTTAGTPGGIRMMAVNAIWMGLDNTEDVISELLSCEYSVEDIGSMMTPDKFDAGLPGWLLQAKQRLTQRDLRTLAKSTEAEVAGIAKCVLELLKLRKKVRPFQVEEMQPIYGLSILRWDVEDSILRCHDDIVQEANQSGGDYYTSEIDLTMVGRESKDFHDWRTATEPSLAAIQLANQLIGYLSIPDESR